LVVGIDGGGSHTRALLCDATGAVLARVEGPASALQTVSETVAADIIKALALGASAVGIGRPYAYGLALGGVDGIVHVLRSLLAEADLIMAVDGYPTLADLTPEALRRVN